MIGVDVTSEVSEDYVAVASINSIVGSISQIIARRIAEGAEYPTCEGSINDHGEPAKDVSAQRIQTKYDMNHIQFYTLAI